ncbi:MAG: PLP-dependent transferase, partial [Flavobacteriales bacterium]
MIDPAELTHILYQLGEENQPGNVVSPPIYLSSNFSFRTIADFQAAIANEIDLPIYSRGSNPTVRLLEQKLAALQGTESALCFGSGSAAVAAAAVSCLKAGDHVITIHNVYSWTCKLLAETLSRFGVSWTQVDGTDSEAVYNALQPNTRVLMLESPTSLNFH